MPHDSVCTRIMAMTRQLALLAWLLLSVCLYSAHCEPRLAKPGATHPSFPLDAFARPAYKVVFQDDNPVDNRTALELLRRSDGKAKGQASDALEQYKGAQARHPSKSSTDEQTRSNSVPDGPYKAYLHRSSPDSLYVCTLDQQPPPLHTMLRLDEKGMLEYRTGVLQRSLKLLAPLKRYCLFHTLDWFTYSLCYGDAVKQFRALPDTLGGGKTPAMDPKHDSFVLGRWKPEVEAIRDATTSLATVGDGQEGEASPADSEDSMEGEDGAIDVIGEGEGDILEQGTELMELVHFSSIDQPDSAGQQPDDEATSSSTSLEGKGRYISQIWSDGTMCNLNNEPRTVEVQFHCAKSPALDRIALIKEVTTCNYVVVVQTPRLCAEPALAQAEDRVDEVRCRPILSEEQLHQRYLKEISDTQASLLEGAAKDATSNGAKHSNKDVSDSSMKVNDVDEPVSLESKSEGESASEVKSSAERSKGSKFEAQLNKLIMNRIKEIKRMPLQEAERSNVELVVGMDEAGNLILEPRGDNHKMQFGTDEEEDGFFFDTLAQQEEGQAKTEEKEDEDESAKQGAGSMSAAQQAEKWAELLKQIKEIGFLNADGAVYEVVQEDGETQGQQESGRDASVSNNGERNNDEERQDLTAAAGGAQRGQRRVVSPGKTVVGQQRGKMMVRETESLAQRVDRLYKAREEEEKKRQGKQNDDKRDNIQHDEL